MLARSLSLVAAFMAIPVQPLPAATPVDQWKVEPSNARCVAARQYSASGKPIILAFKAPAQERRGLQMAILRQGFRKQHVQTGAKLEIDGRAFPTTALSYPTNGDTKRVTHLINLDGLMDDTLRTGSELKVTIEDGISETFPVAGMASIRAELDRCLEQLRATWNVCDDHKTYVTGPIGNLTANFSAADYPMAARMAKQTGTTAVLMLVDEQGVPRDCTIIETSGAAVLDSRACGILLARARFTPAVDAAGKPVKSPFRQVISWRLEGQ